MNNQVPSLWAQNIEPSMPIQVVLGMRGYGVTRPAPSAHYLRDDIVRKTEMILPRANFQPFANPPESSDLNTLFQLYRDRILLVLEATGRADLTATIDQHFELYLRHLSSAELSRIVPVGLVNKTHAHAYRRYGPTDKVLRRELPSDGVPYSVGLAASLREKGVHVICEEHHDIPSAYESLLRSLVRVSDVSLVRAEG